MSLHIFVSPRDRQEETHVSKFAFFVQLQFSPIFNNFTQFSSISASSLKEQTIFTNSLKESMSFHHFSSLFTTSRQFSTNFCQFLSISRNSHQLPPISAKFHQFHQIFVNLCQFQPISLNFGQFVKRDRQLVTRDRQFVKSKQSTYLSRFSSFRIQLCTNADNYFVVVGLSSSLTKLTQGLQQCSLSYCIAYHFKPLDAAPAGAARGLSFRKMLHFGKIPKKTVKFGENSATFQITFG